MTDPRRPAAIAPRPLPPLLLVGLVPIAAWFILRPFLAPAPPLPPLWAATGFAILALLFTIYLVPALGPVFIKANLKGRDLLKLYRDDPAAAIPESMGLVCAAVYILLLILFIPFAFSDAFIARQSPGEGLPASDGFPLHQLSVYLSSLLSLLIATMLGFLDDIFDIRWRHKIPVPIIASIPLLMVYFAEQGNTNVVVPRPLRPFFSTTLINLGPLYYLYMSLLSTFATNSFNILAGINGSEAVQALIIAVSVILNDLLYMPWPFDFRIPLYLLGNQGEVDIGGVWKAGMAHGSKVLVERHLFSLYFMLPLVAVCLGFLYHNWYPARAFPGDTFCYLTGMAFAVVGIQAHFSKTLLLFFIPQIFNFLLSCPQLFGLVPCPRHRVPRPDHTTNRLYPSMAGEKDKGFEKPLKPLGTVILRLFAKVGLTELEIDPTTGAIRNATNLTILNFFLVRLGPMNEKRLTQVLVCTQIAGSVLAFVVRYGLAGIVYDGDRR